MESHCAMDNDDYLIDVVKKDLHMASETPGKIAINVATIE